MLTNGHLNTDRTRLSQPLCSSEPAALSAGGWQLQTGEEEAGRWEEVRMEVLCMEAVVEWDRSPAHRAVSTIRNRLPGPDCPQHTLPTVQPATP